MRTLEALNRTGPNIFVPGHVIPALYAARWARHAGIWTVAVLHNDDAYNKALLTEFGRPNLKWKDHVVCVSPRLAQAAFARTSPRTTSFIPYGVDIPEFSAKSPDDTLKLIYLGRIAQEQKRIIETTRVLLACARQIPSVEADIYGAGPDRESVSRILETEGRDLPVRLHSRVENSEVQRKFADSNVFILLSDYEGMPITLLEGMAVGLVPICFNIRSGVPDLVEHGETGFLVNDREDEVVRTVERLRFDRDLWQHISARARDKIRSEYSIEVCAARWIALLEQLANPKHQPISIPRSIRLPSPKREFGSGDNRRMPLVKRVVERLAKMARG